MNERLDNILNSFTKEEEIKPDIQVETKTKIIIKIPRYITIKRVKV